MSVKQAQLVLWLALMAFASCEHRELCVDHTHTAEVDFTIDWSQYTEERPTGMTIMVYPQNGEKPIKYLTNDIYRVKLDLEAGIYDAFVFNQSVEEYAYVGFRGMDTFETAEAYATTTESRWYNGKMEEEKVLNGERVVDEPEWMATDTMMNIVVTKAMVDSTEKALQKNNVQKRRASNFFMGRFVPQNIMSTIVVTVHLDGIYNLRSEKAWLSGLAEGYFLGQHKISGNRVTQIIERWNVQQDKADPTKGTITATMISFGLPERHALQPKDNILNLSLLLVDNKTMMKYTFEVGDQMRYDEQAERTMYINLTIKEPLPDVKPEGAEEGGFDVTVDDWGEDENVDIEV